MNPHLTAITKILEEISQKPNIFGSALTSIDGLLITSYLPAGVDKRHFAAMSATMTSAAMAMGTSIGNISTNNIRVNLDHHEIYCTFSEYSLLQRTSNTRKGARIIADMMILSKGYLFFYLEISYLNRKTVIIIRQD